MATLMAWGGPEHGRMVRVDDPRRGFVIFPIRRRPTARSFDPDPDPYGPSFGTVSYDVEKFAWRDRSWLVLVYPENKDTQKRQLEVAANFVLWLANR